MKRVWRQREGGIRFSGLEGLLAALSLEVVQDHAWPIHALPLRLHSPQGVSARPADTGTSEGVTCEMGGGWLTSNSHISISTEALPSNGRNRTSTVLVHPAQPHT